MFLSPRISTVNDEDIITENNQDQERESLIYSIGVGTDYLWTLITNEDINMFAGTGIILTYGNHNAKVTVNTNGDKNINEINNPSANIGIRGTLGVEWKVTTNIGIHSEYLYTGSYNWSKAEIKSSINGVNNPIRTRTSTGFSFGSGVLFGVSIYL